MAQKFWIDLEDTSGNKLGSGPLTSVIRWTSTRRLNRIGTFSFEVHPTDPRSSLIATKAIAKCYGLVNDTVTEIGAGIIDQIRINVSDSGTTLVVSGDDLMRELTWRSVHDLSIFDETLDDPDYVISLTDGTFADLTTNLTDGTSSTSGFELDGTDDFLFIGYSEPFNLHYWIYTADVNVNSGNLGYGYSNSSTTDEFTGWPELDTITDNNIQNSKPYSVDGSPTASATYHGRPALWVNKSITFGGLGAIDKYWIRIDPTGDIARSGGGTVEMEECGVGVRDISTDDLTDIIALAPAGWAFDTATVLTDTAGSTFSPYDQTTNGTYSQFAGESVFSALLKTALKANERFRLGTGRNIQWLQQKQPDSQVFLVRHTNAAEIGDNPDVAIIKRITKNTNGYNQISRVYPYGSGNGAARVTLLNAKTYGGITRPPTGYTLDTDENYIAHTATESGARIERVLSFKEVRPNVAETYDSIEVSNALYDIAENYLSQHITDEETYDVDVIKLEKSVLPGDYVKIRYREVVGSYIHINLDGELLALETTQTIDSAGLRTTAMRLSSKNWWPSSDEEILAHTIEAGVVYEAHPQPIDARLVRVVG